MNQFGRAHMHIDTHQCQLAFCFWGRISSNDVTIYGCHFGHVTKIIINKLSLPHPKESPYEFYVRLEKNSWTPDALYRGSYMSVHN